MIVFDNKYSFYTKFVLGFESTGRSMELQVRKTFAVIYYVRCILNNAPLSETSKNSAKLQQY